jgi:hypothetical protein
VLIIVDTAEAQVSNIYNGLVSPVASNLFNIWFIRVVKASACKFLQIRKKFQPFSLLYWSLNGKADVRKGILLGLIFILSDILDLSSRVKEKV